MSYLLLIYCYIDECMSKNGCQTSTGVSTAASPETGLAADSGLTSITGSIKFIMRYQVYSRYKSDLPEDFGWMGLESIIVTDLLLDVSTDCLESTQPILLMTLKLRCNEQALTMYVMISTLGIRTCLDVNTKYLI